MRRVKIAGHPERYAWMEDLVGRVGIVEEELPLHGGEATALKVSGLPGGEFWISEAYCEAVVEEGEGAA